MCSTQHILVKNKLRPNSAAKSFAARERETMKKIEFTLNNTKHTITMYTDGIETFVNLDVMEFSVIAG